MAVYKAPDGKDNRSGNRYKASNERQSSARQAKAGRASSSGKPQKDRQTKKKKSHRGLITFIIIVFVIAACCAIAFLILRGSEQASTLPTQPTELVSFTTETTQAHSVEKIDMPALDSDDGSDGYLDGSVYIWNNKGFEVFKGNVKTAVSYANSISNYKTTLGENITVYNMVVPTNTEFGLPERLSKTVSNYQRENTEAIITNLSADIVPIDIYNVLAQNRNEASFYNTDKLWTNKGAYYAYSEFAKITGITPVAEKKLTATKADHKFTGDYIEATVSLETQKGDPNLLKSLDTVSYYELPKNCKVTAMRLGAVEEDEISFYSTDTTEESSPVEIFNSAACAYAKITNSDIKSGKKIAIVKDSYGEMLAPLFAQHYKEVHLVDITNFKRNLKTYCTENGISEVLFLTSIMSANSGVQTAKLDALFD